MEVLATRRFFNKSGNITPRLLNRLYTLRSSFQSDSRTSLLQKQARQDCKKERAGLNTKTSWSRMERRTSRAKTGPPIISYYDCGYAQKKRLLLSFFEVDALPGSCWIFLCGWVCGIFHIFWRSVILLRSIENFKKAGDSVTGERWKYILKNYFMFLLLLSELNKIPWNERERSWEFWLSFSLPFS